MKKFNYFLASILLPAALGITLAACGDSSEGDSQPSASNSQTSELPSASLAAPVISLGADYTCSWSAVDGATGYVVNINGNDLNTTTSLTLSAFTDVGEYSIKIAATDGTNKSEWSNAVSYSVYSVTLPQGDLYTLAGESTVYSGKSYTFTLTQAANVEGTPIVKANGTPLTGNEGTYTIENVSANQVITVEGLVKQSFAVTKPSAPVGYTLTGEEKAVYGEDYTFTVALDEAYSNSAVVVKVNGEIVTATEGVYKVANVTQAFAITVEGIEKNVYTVTAPSKNAAYTFAGADVVAHGDSYTFTLTVSNGYNVSGLVVKVNGEAITGENNTYTVANVSGALTITVEGLGLATYGVTKPATQVGYALVGADTVTHGDTYTFTITLEEAYADSAITVKVNGEIVTGENGTYTVVNASGALEITVEGVEMNAYVVSVPTNASYTLEGNVNQEVAYGETVTFTITPASIETVITVKNGDTVLTATNNQYTVENVTEDITITVDVKVVSLAKQFLLAENWGYTNLEDDKTTSFTESETALTVTDATSVHLNIAFVQKLWEAGYTHLAFDVQLADDAQDILYRHGGEGTWDTWQTFWKQQEVAANNTVRIDLSEFEDNGTYYTFNLHVRERGVGNANKYISSLVISNPRAFKSAETLEWVKYNGTYGEANTAITNAYFALEDGYYVFDAHSALDKVASPTEWLEKYSCVTDGNNIRGTLFYFDYIEKGTNTQSFWYGINADATKWDNSILVDGLMVGTFEEGYCFAGFNKLAYVEGNVFSIWALKSGVGRFKMSDWVSNKHHAYASLGYADVENNAYTWSAPVTGIIGLATTQDYIAAGYNKLNITLKGDIGSTTLWYGARLDKSWNGNTTSIKASQFINGEYTFTVDLASGKYDNGEIFGLLAQDAAINNLEISYTPIKLATGEKTVTKPAEQVGYTLTGADTVNAGEDYTFTLALDGIYSDSKPIVKVNGVPVFAKNGVYTVEKVEENLEITVDGIQKNRYSVVITAGEGYTVEEGNKLSVAHGESVSFTVIPQSGIASLTVTCKGVVLTGDNNVYTVENVTADTVISVEAHSLIDGLLLAENWGYVNNETAKTTAMTEDTDSLTIYNANHIYLKTDFVKKLWRAGYTHLAFDVSNLPEGAQDVYYRYGTDGTWATEWQPYTRQQDITQNNTIRIDLSEFVVDGNYYTFNINTRASGITSANVYISNITISNPRAFKSAETLEWTKYNSAKQVITNAYFALEDGYYVFEAHVDGGIVESPTEWLDTYCFGATGRGVTFYSDYVEKGANTTSMRYGVRAKGSPAPDNYLFLNSINNTVDGNPSYAGTVDAGYTFAGGISNAVAGAGNAFSLHMTSKGVARFKMSEWIPTHRHTSGNVMVGYADVENDVYKLSGTDSGANGSPTVFGLATTHEYIAAGYTKLTVTLKGDLGSATLMYGAHTGSGFAGSTYKMLKAADFVNGEYTIEVDLTHSDYSNKEKRFSLVVTGAKVNDLEVLVTPDENSRITPEVEIKNTVIYDNTNADTVDAYEVTAYLLAEELKAITGDEYSVMTVEQVESLNVTGNYFQCVQLGLNPNGRDFQDLSLGEHYVVEGDDRVINIDGNCPRAIAYGMYDMLRYYGCEYYTADLIVYPDAAVALGEIYLEDTPDFAIRQYLAADTAFVSSDGASVDLQTARKAFALSAKMNNGGYVDSFGMNEKVVAYGDPSHNFINYFDDHTEGKYGMTVATGNASPSNAFAPCLTNGITYNVGGADTTLTYAISRMKALMLENPNAVYFGFGQMDGTTWYCHCEHCAASDTTYKASGTLIRFINAMIVGLRADQEIGDRPFTIITLAYGFTNDAPTNGVTLNASLCIQYAPLATTSYFDYRYSITDENQKADAKAKLEAWAPVIGEGSMSLYLYDASYNNYLVYYPSTTINAALDGTLEAAKSMNVDNLFVLGSYNGNNNNWQAAMKAYVWGKKMWDTSLDTASLQNEFIEAYFGPAADKVKAYISTYDAAYANMQEGWYVSTGIWYTNGIDFTTHIQCLQLALDAVAAVENATGLSEEMKANYLRRANAVLASSYGTLIVNYDEYYKEDSLLHLTYRTQYLGASSELDSCADAKANFKDMLKAACKAADIIRFSETATDIDAWLANPII